MFLQSKLSWNVVVPAERLDAEGLDLQRAILTGLLDDFAKKKASKDLGHFMAVTTLDHIGEGVVREHSGEILFPVDFSCITFKMLRGEIMEGVVHRVQPHGVFLRCGPIDKVFMSLRKVGDYQYVFGERPFFKSEACDIKKGTLVRFVVKGVKFNEAERELHALVSLEGDHLGPISKAYPD